MGTWYSNDLLVYGDGVELIVDKMEAQGWSVIFRSERAIHFTLETKNSVDPIPACVDRPDWLVVIGYTDDYGDNDRYLSVSIGGDRASGHFNRQGMHLGGHWGPTHDPWPSDEDDGFPEPIQPEEFGIVFDGDRIEV
jgi:hypothetical protein